MKQMLASDTFVPPQRVQAVAATGLALRAKFGRGGTAVGVARARDLSNGKALPLATIRRMHSYFSRHLVDKKGKDWGNSANPSAGKVAWYLWGGDPGREWVSGIRARAIAAGVW